MQLLVFTVIGLLLLVICVGLDIGGTVGAMLFLLTMLIGGIVRAYAQLIAWLRGPAADLDG